MTQSLLDALNSGQNALESGDFAEATEHFAAAHKLVPSDVSIGIALANVYRLQNDLAGQRRVLSELFKQGDWKAAGAAHALGGALLEVGEATAAAQCFSHVVALLPRDPAALAALAAARRASGDAAGAWPLIKQAVEMSPRTATHLLTAAQVRHDLGDLLGALNWLDKADRVRPDHGPTRLQRAYTSLLRAPSASGWANFEYRALPQPGTAARPWQGEPINGRSVLVTAEQGVGDQFQFLRFVNRLTQAGAGRIVVECDAALVGLLRANGMDAIARGQPPETDLHVPLLSLPHRLALGSTLDADRVPYLRAPDVPTPDLPAPDGRPRIGLVWAGNPDFPGRLTRDLDPALLPELAAIDNVQWISLQQGSAGDVSVTGLGRLPPLRDWSVTARLLTELDGLVTTDTGIAHLAGAMGVPGWIMLQKVPDWRWGLTGTRSNWYPSLNLLRQPRAGDWRDVIRQVRAAFGSA